MIHGIPGGDVAGVVDEVGKDVQQFKKGDEVYGSTGMVGAWAEYACCREKDLCPKPTNLSFEEAATVPVAGATALGAVRAAKIKAGEQVLIYGASGGVGHFAAHIAKPKGGIVTGVCSTRNLTMMEKLGMDAAIDYTKEDFSQLGPIYAIGSGKKMKGVAYPLLKDKGPPYLKELMEAGKIKPVIDHIYPMREVPGGIRYVIKDHAQGKVAITMV